MKGSRDWAFEQLILVPLFCLTLSSPLLVEIKNPHRPQDNLERILSSSLSRGICTEHFVTETYACVLEHALASSTTPTLKRMRTRRAGSETGVFSSPPTQYGANSTDRGHRRHRRHCYWRMPTTNCHPREVDEQSITQRLQNSCRQRGAKVLTICSVRHTNRGESMLSRTARSQDGAKGHYLVRTRALAKKKKRKNRPRNEEAPANSSSQLQQTPSGAPKRNMKTTRCEG